MLSLNNFGVDVRDWGNWISKADGLGLDGEGLYFLDKLRELYVFECELLRLFYIFIVNFELSLFSLEISDLLIQFFS